jgi:HAD-hyrolase-like
LDGAWLRAMLEPERTLAAAEGESVSWPRTRQPLWWRRATVTSTSKRSPRSAGRKRFAGLRCSFGRQPNRWWRVGEGRKLLDAGVFVAGLEYAAGVEAEVIGKPSRAYFEAALAELGAEPQDAFMVGDDVESDVGGAKAIGMRGVLVRTGKFEEETLAAADPQPDAVIDSIADLPALLRDLGAESSRPDTVPA